MAETIAERLSEFIHGLSFESIPRTVVEKTKDHILDTLGICIASSRMEFGGAALNLIGSWGGKPESSLIGFPGRVPAQNAALANGVLAHGQDYDDTHTEAVVHPSSCLVPVALAIGQRGGKAGREVLTALVGGLEIMIRIGMPAQNRFHLRGFHTTSICGTFASALIAAKLDGFDHEKMVQALGISGSFTSGLLECIPSGSGAKRLHAGWAGLCGIVAAGLVGAGYTGPRTVFEGRLGLYPSFLKSEPLDLTAIFKGLGTDWEVLNIGPKLYPCCHFLQSFLDCAAYLRKKHRLQPEDVAKIECRVPQGAVNIVCEPWEKKIFPKTDYDTRFSLPFAVCLMLATGKAGTAEFSERSLRDPDINLLMAKVSYAIEPSFQVKDMPGWITVTLKSGDRLDHRIDRVRGDSLDPVDREELIGKFHDNTAALGREKGRRIAEGVFKFENLQGIDDLMEGLS
jgi:2-methylcitrate dehydratase PrpD